MFDSSIAAAPHVVGRPLQELGDFAELLTGAGQHRETNHLVVIEAARRQGAHRVVRDLEVAPAKKVRDCAVVDAAKLDDQTGMPRAAPLDLALRAFENQSPTRVESIFEICQGVNLDSPLDSIGAGDL